ncbi:uncharacterized protein FMAN_16177 [Fusarium mangiferae]|uniref:Uncharacterized protein n=1 Tax=Fusarium mangiferae TaxID=192010 RepID=A0A1L7TKX5_FUSMA|nr:uncharacterized protein FMAN_16177 [Fusarium mangiferae]CVK99320.1 uncharacterized protein FMAN_16177 [Fusarium mangiferae]
MAAAPGQTLTITGPNGQPQLVSLIPLPITASELALALSNLPPPPVEGEVSSFPASATPGRPKVTAADRKPITFKEILVCIRRKVEADTEQNKNRRRELFLDKKKRRVPTDELVGGGLVKKLK